MPHMKRPGFYCELPRTVISDIALASQAKRIPKWQVITDAIRMLPGRYFVSTGGLRRKSREKR